MESPLSPDFPAKYLPVHTTPEESLSQHVEEVSEETEPYSPLSVKLMKKASNVKWFPFKNKYKLLSEIEDPLANLIIGDELRYNSPSGGLSYTQGTSNPPSSPLPHTSNLTLPSFITTSPRLTKESVPANLDLLPVENKHYSTEARPPDVGTGTIQDIDIGAEMVHVKFQDGAIAKLSFHFVINFMSKVSKEKKEMPKIPSWSLQDRIIRAQITPSGWITFLGSSIPLAFIYIFSFLVPNLFVTYHRGTSTVIISCFIMLQTVVTLIRAIPAEDASNHEVNDRINASILISMVLYPCLGLWVTDDDGLSWATFWKELSVLHESMDDLGLFQWGLIFPFFLWSASATLLVRDSNYAFTLDRQGVVTDDNSQAVTALFRRNPSLMEVWTHKITTWLTFSLWSVVPSRYRPAGGGGRFAFQLSAPVVVLFFFISYRFVYFAYQEIVYIVTVPGDYTRFESCQDMITDVGGLLQMQLIVWSCFTVYCVIIRGVIAHRSFLSHVIPDTHSFKNRWVGWNAILIESKRSRVLWAFRGWAIPAVRYYIWYTGINRHSTFVGCIAYYLYLCVYISFFFEGISAFFFGLIEAERGCNLKTPFRLLYQLCFWSAFNTYLQPFGTIVNALIYAINKEFRMDLHLREIFGPFLLTERNTFRYSLPMYSTPKLPTQSELDERLDEWISTWRRKRQDAGRDTTSYTVKDLGNAPYPNFSGPVVFKGSMFPTYHEWVYMRDHCEDYISLLPWDRANGPEKFLQWYPSYREEIMTLLREPYDFTIRREVWFFGYGSLISPSSPPPGLSDSQRKQIIPYWLKKQAGYSRTWNYRHGPVGINAFGMEMAENGSDGKNISGCVYPIDYERASDLFSIREEGYELLLIHEAYFEPMHKDFPMPEGVGYVWVSGEPILKHHDTLAAMNNVTKNRNKKLTKSNDGSNLSGFKNGSVLDHTTENITFDPESDPETSPNIVLKPPSPELLDVQQTSNANYSDIECKRHNPTQDSPILQSYIDTIIEGALRYRTAGIGHTDGMRFAASILASTIGWNYSWFNDRVLSGRPWTFMPTYEIIDGLLSTCPTSRDAFVNRLRPSMQSLSEQRSLLEQEKTKNIDWANEFYNFD